MEDCEQIGQLLEAYALGAVAPEDAGAIEEHLADCLACWEHLSDAQKSAALLALAVPLEEPREQLRQRILAQARAEATGPATPPKSSGGGGRAMPLGLGVLAAGAVAALVWAFVLQDQTEDLRADYRSLEQQAVASQQMLSDQRQLTSLMLDEDMQTTDFRASGIAAGSMAHYVWSPGSRMGAIICHNLKPAPEGMTYQLWFFLADGFVDGGTFAVIDGISQRTVDLAKLPSRPHSIGVTVETLGGSSEPTGDMVLTSAFPGGTPY